MKVLNNGVVGWVYRGYKRQSMATQYDFIFFWYHNIKPKGGMDGHRRGRKVKEWMESRRFK